MDDPVRSAVTLEPRELLARVRRIADDITAAAAPEVDQQARFPKETVDALKDAGALSAGLPPELGGAGCDTRQLASLCSILGERCAASGMILAMHYIQVACILHHGMEVPALRDYLRRLAVDQRLIASVTSEVGVDGDLRRSIAAITEDDGRFTFSKHATTVSYGGYADDLLVTLRRHGDAAEHDQCLVLALSGGFELAEPGDWDTLGMRGTCSPGARVNASGESWQILPVPFAEIAPHTMVPFSHLMWAGCWIGIATDAARRARAVVQTKARRNPAVAPRGAERLADLDARLQLMKADHDSVIDLYDQALRSERRIGPTDIGLALRVNNLKLNASQLLRDIVLEAFDICGISGYRNDSEHSLGRHLRDAMSASLMISNDRIRAGNGAMHLVHKGGAVLGLSERRF